MMCCLQRLSIVRNFHREAVHMKKGTIKGALDLHNLNQTRRDVTIDNQILYQVIFSIRVSHPMKELGIFTPLLTTTHLTFASSSPPPKESSSPVQLQPHPSLLSPHQKVVFVLQFHLAP